MTRRQFGAVTAASAVATVGSGNQSKAGSDIADLYARSDAINLAEYIRRGEVTPAELLEVAVQRTDAVDPALNAVTLKHYDLARQRAAGNDDRPLRRRPRFC